MSVRVFASFPPTKQTSHSTYKLRKEWKNYEKISKSNNEREKRRDTKTKIIFLSWDRERSTETKHQLNGAWCGDSVWRDGACVCVDVRLFERMRGWMNVSFESNSQRELFFSSRWNQGSERVKSFEFPFVYHDRNWLLLCYFKESAKMYNFASFLFSRDITENIFLSLDFCFDDISWVF